MEYLTTYGWAILVIVVLASLLYLYSSAPETAPPTTCTFISGVYCNAIVVGTNTVTKATTVGIFLSNSQPYPIANPRLFAKVSGQNTTTVQCSPNYVISGGSLVCSLQLSTTTSLGQFLAGQLYLNATYCGLQVNYSQANLCSSAPRETYSGSFDSHIEPLIGTNTIITLSAANSSQLANGGLDSLTATVKLLGYPLPGATVNFTANVPGYVMAPNVTVTNNTGTTLSHISGTKAGNVLVSARYGGLIANTVIQFLSSTNVKFAVTGFPYCSTAGQIITIDGAGYTCSQLTAATFSWAQGSVHSCAVNAIVTDNSFVQGACKTSGLFCTANQNTTLTLNCTPQYYLTESASPGAGGSVLPGSGWHNNTSSVTISETNSVGYIFNGWTGVGTGSYTGASTSTGITINSPITETAGYTQPFSATCGGTLTLVAGNDICTFTSSGTFTVAGSSANVAVLVVAGGGSGGWEVGGGGGAGGLIYNALFPVSPQAYSVTVGIGGISNAMVGGQNGVNSIFSTLTAIGGGVGYGGAGGSGGALYNGQAGSPGSGTAGQGNNAGSGGYESTGGGGGAGAVGGNGGSNSGGAGGAGATYSISGSAVTYAGGGGGYGYSGGGSGGSGGGGGGGYYSSGGGSATANTGGGGGGDGTGHPGGAGGSGIVIIAYNALGNGTP